MRVTRVELKEIYMSFTEQLKNIFKDSIFAELDPNSEVLSESVRTDLVQLLSEKMDIAVATKIADKEQELIESYKETNKEFEARILTESEKTIDDRVDEEIRQLEESIRAAMADELGDHKRFITEYYERRLEQFKSDELSQIEEAVEAKVEQYIQEQVESCLPAEMIIEQAEVKQLKDTIGVIREHVLVNDMVLSESTRSLIDDTNKTIKQLEKDKNEMLSENAKLKDSVERAQAEAEKAKKDLLAENAKLKQTIERQEARTLLESKIKDFPPSKRDHLSFKFQDASVKDIESGLNEAAKAYDDHERSRKRKLVSENAQKKETIKRRSDLLRESKQEVSSIEKYGEIIKNSIRYK
jgi:hypothetical protein